MADSFQGSVQPEAGSPNRFNGDRLMTPELQKLHDRVEALRSTYIDARQGITYAALTYVLEMIAEVKGKGKK